MSKFALLFFAVLIGSTVASAQLLEPSAQPLDLSKALEITPEQKPVIQKPLRPTEFRQAVEDSTDKFFIGTNCLANPALYALGFVDTTQVAPSLFDEMTAEAPAEPSILSEFPLPTFAIALND